MYVKVFMFLHTPCVLLLLSRLTEDEDGKRNWLHWLYKINCNTCACIVLFSLHRWGCWKSCNGWNVGDSSSLINLATAAQVHLVMNCKACAWLTSGVGSSFILGGGGGGGGGPAVMCVV